ncbi:hypothetical protein T484DRAFT_1790197 [Baffinella frigidus]|nr:hypothetical protein T484DRAFT_1790197 [Cryptophyta sp. CCMP2293]
MHDGRGDGVVVRDSGLGIVEENRIFMNAAVGVKVMATGMPEVHHNEINNGNGVGMHLFPGALGHYTNNKIHANYGDQIRIEGNPVVKNNEELSFADNHIDWTTQPSFRLPDLFPIVRAQPSSRLPDLFPIVRAQADSAFLDEKEKTSSKTRVSSMKQSTRLVGSMLSDLSGTTPHSRGPSRGEATNRSWRSSNKGEKAGKGHFDNDDDDDDDDGAYRDRAGTSVAY